MLYKQQNVSINNNNTMSNTASNQIAPLQLVGHDDEITSISCYLNPIRNKTFENGSNIISGATSTNYSFTDNNNILSTLPFLLVSTSLDNTIKL